MPKTYTILVVDGSTTNLAVIYDYLDRLGYRVLIAETGEAAVDRALLAEPDVILMEVLLPGINGYEAARQLKQAAETRQIPVVFMSDNGDPQSRTQSYQAGGFEHMTKPLLYEELRALLQAQVALLELRANQLDRGNSSGQSTSEFDSIIDLMAHDIKNPLHCILGFAEELEEGFKEHSVPAEWSDYARMIKESSSNVDLIFDALVLFKNLGLRAGAEPEATTIESVLQSMHTRYKKLEREKPLSLQFELEVEQVMTDPTLLEELLLILLRNLSALTPESENLEVFVATTQTDREAASLSITANTRPLDEDEIKHLLEPLSGNKRRRVKGTNILMLCAQKITECLSINASCESGTKGLIIKLSLDSVKQVSAATL